MVDTKNANIKIIAILIVSIIVIAAFAVYFVTKDAGSSDAKVESELSIRGNANQDETIGNDDLTIINEIIAGEKELKSYPFADANDDGVVDSKDVEIVKKLINREPTEVYVVCLDSNAIQTVVKAQYPLTNIVPIGTNMIDPILNVGGVDSIAGYFYSAYKNAESVLIKSSAVDFKGSSRSISESSWMNFMQLDSSLVNKGAGIGALVVDQSVSFLNDYRADIQDAGIPEIRFAVANAYEEVSATLTIGFLLGGEIESKSLRYAQLSWNVFSQVDEVIGNMPDADKKTYISITMGNYVCQNHSTFNMASSYAGGIAYHKTNPEFNNIYSGTGSVKMSSAEALSNYDDCDYIISNRSLDYGISVTTHIVEQWEKYKGYFENLDNYENLVYINNILPGACKIAYLATVFSSGSFSESWADGVLSDFMKLCVTFEGHTMDDVVTLFTYEDYVCAKNI